MLCIAEDYYAVAHERSFAENYGKDSAASSAPVPLPCIAEMIK